MLSPSAHLISSIFAALHTLPYQRGDLVMSVSNTHTKYGDRNTNCGNAAIYIHNTIPAQQPDKAKSEILKWISPLELTDRHHAVAGLRFEGVGDWLLRTDEFRDWAYGSADPTLFCYGDPGVGKTYTSSLVIDTLCYWAGKRNFCVFYQYCDYRAPEGQSATDLIAGLLKKVVAGLDETPKGVSRNFEKSKEHRGDQRRPLLLDVVTMLGEILQSLKRPFICIDALDELPPEQRLELLLSLAKLIRVWPGTRLFLTGRPQIRDEIEDYLGETAQIISIRAREEGIKTYITHRLARDPNSREMNPELKNDIMKTLLQEASGILLLVRLKMNTILEALNVHERRARLLATRDGPELKDEYRNTLCRIGDQGREKSELARKVLMWLCYSKRPLHPDELRHALAVEKGPTCSDPEKASSIGTLLGCCLGLVTADEGKSTISLVHPTLKDFLCRDPKPIQWAGLTIAETCLTYLNFEDNKSLSLSLCTAPAEAPFLQYASCYWGEHAREKPTDGVKTLAENLLSLYDKHISAKLLLLQKAWPWWCDPKSRSCGFSGLHCAAFFGLREIANALLDIDVSSLSQRDITGSTPLIWAARNGHRELVQLLLERGGIRGVGAKDYDGCTPFSWAARNGYEEVVALFLEKGAIGLETEDSFGRTPLSWASGSGHQEVVRLLLDQQNISPGKKDYNGRTPLSWASGGGYKDVVELLLTAGKANINSTDSEGRTPVSWAAEGGCEEVINYFLREQNVDPNLRDRDGRTLLSRAAESGNWPVVKLLLDQPGIVPDRADKGGMTPLSWAASKGNEAVVKLFMEKGETGTDLADKDCSTSLWWAAGGGHAGVVGLLLGRKSVDPNFVGDYGRTPLVRAAMHGHEQVVKLLLESRRVDHNLADSSGRTPLSWAAGNWRSKVVGLLLKSGDIDTEFADTDGWTPLKWATWNGDERVIQQLLKKGNPKSDSRDTDGRTPVSWAVGNGCDEVGQLLIDHPDVNPDSTDDGCRSPLSRTVE